MNHWSLLFAAPLLAYSPPEFGRFGFYPMYLLVPLAALAGTRFGLAGVISIALGGLAFVFTLAGGSWGVLGGSPSLYLISLAVAAIAASPRPLAEWLHWPKEDRAAKWLAFAAPFLLALGIGIRPQGGAELRLALQFGFSLLGYFLLFVLGARGVRPWPLLAGLAAAAALSWTLRLNGFPKWPPDIVTVALAFDVLQPAVVFAALAAFSAGAATGAFLAGRPPPAFWRRPYVAVAVLVVFLWFGPDPIASMRVDVPGVFGIHLLGLPSALPIAAFMAGLLGGARGATFVSFLVPGVMLAWECAALLASNYAGWHSRPRYVALEAPFVAMAFAVLGAKLAQARTGAADFRLPRWPLFVLLVAATGFAIFEGGSLTSKVLGGIFVVGSCAIFAAGVRLQRAMAGTAFEITSNRWLSFAAVVILAGTVLTNLQGFAAMLRQFDFLLLLPQAIADPAAAKELRSMLDGTINIEFFALIIVLAAIYLWSVVRSLAASVAKVAGDLRRIAAFARQRRRA